MKAVILAAGKGSRISETTGSIPKCLLKINFTTLIDAQISSLRACGVEEIVVVAGYQAELVRERCGNNGIIYIENPLYAQTNSLYSLWLARDYLLDGFVVMNADVLFHQQMLKDLLTSQYDDALLVSYCDQHAPMVGEEEMKVRIRRGQVICIDKKINPLDADAENVGIAKFGPDGAQLLLEKANELISKGNLDCWVPRAFQEFAAWRPLYAVSTRGYPWIEIDFPEDYHRAVDEIQPRIAALSESLAMNG